MLWCNFTFSYQPDNGMLSSAICCAGRHNHNAVFDSQAAARKANFPDLPTPTRLKNLVVRARRC